MAEAQDRSQRASRPATSGDTVTVALKYPVGIILEVFKESTEKEQVVGGPVRDVKVWRTTGKRHVLNGNAVPHGVQPAFDIWGGYAITRGVPRDIWEVWKEQHADSELVTNGLIVAFDSLRDAQTECESNLKGLRSGLERLLRKGDPRVPKRRAAGGKFVDAVELFESEGA